MITLFLALNTLQTPKLPQFSRSKDFPYVMGMAEFARLGDSVILSDLNGDVFSTSLKTGQITKVGNYGAEFIICKIFAFGNQRIFLRGGSGSGSVSMMVEFPKTETSVKDQVPRDSWQVKTKSMLAYVTSQNQLRVVTEKENRIFPVGKDFRKNSLVIGEKNQVYGDNGAKVFNYTQGKNWVANGQLLMTHPYFKTGFRELVIKRSGKTLSIDPASGRVNWTVDGQFEFFQTYDWGTLIGGNKKIAFVQKDGRVKWMKSLRELSTRGTMLSVNFGRFVPYASNTRMSYLNLDNGTFSPNKPLFAEEPKADWYVDVLSEDSLICFNMKTIKFRVLTVR